MIPIFIITRDRVSCLKRCIENYKSLGDIEIIIHDNGSTYPPMVEYLNELESKGIAVCKHPEQGVKFVPISDSVNRTVQEWFKSHREKYYIVTDPDILLDNPSPAMLEYYKQILGQRPMARVVGPMLRIDDIPGCFKFKEEMIKSHEKQFWNKEPERFKSGFIQKAPIDTTFGMYRAGFPFRRLNMGIRTYAPWTAIHLDWYLDSDNLSEEQVYYMEHANKQISTLTNHYNVGKMK